MGVSPASVVDMMVILLVVVLGDTTRVVDFQLPMLGVVTR